MRPGLEAAQAGALRGAQERERRDRRAGARGVVVAAGSRAAARHALVRDHGRVDPVVDRIADLRVVDRALDDPRAADPPVLRPEEDRVVRLVPGEPELHGRQDAPVRAGIGAAVADRRGEREVLEVLGVIDLEVAPVRRHVAEAAEIEPTVEEPLDKRIRARACQQASGLGDEDLRLEQLAALCEC